MYMAYNTSNDTENQHICIFLNLELLHKFQSKGIKMVTIRIFIYKFNQWMAHNYTQQLKVTLTFIILEWI